MRDTFLRSIQRIKNRAGFTRPAPDGFPFELPLEHRLDPDTGQPDHSVHRALRYVYADNECRLAPASRYGAGMSAWFSDQAVRDAVNLNDVLTHHRLGSWG